MATGTLHSAPSVVVVTENDAEVRRVRRALRGTEFEGRQYLASSLSSARQEALRVGCVVLVGRLQHHSLSETVEVLAQSAPVVVMGRDDGGELLGVVRAGAAGFFPLSSVGLAAAVRAASNGEAVLPRRLLGQLFASLEVRPSGSASDTAARLTAREWDVLRLLHEGHATHAIARRLYVSPVTVRTHVHALLRKFEAQDRPQLLARTQGFDRRRHNSRQDRED